MAIKLDIERLRAPGRCSSWRSRRSFCRTADVPAGGAVQCELRQATATGDASARSSSRGSKLARAGPVEVPWRQHVVCSARARSRCTSRSRAPRSLGPMRIVGVGERRMWRGNNEGLARDARISGGDSIVVRAMNLSMRTRRLCAFVVAGELEPPSRRIAGALDAPSRRRADEGGTHGTGEDVEQHRPVGRQARAEGARRRQRRVGCRRWRSAPAATAKSTTRLTTFRTTSCGSASRSSPTSSAQCFGKRSGAGAARRASARSSSTTIAPVSSSAHAASRRRALPSATARSWSRRSDARRSSGTGALLLGGECSEEALDAR